MVAFNAEEMKPENRMARICDFMADHADEIIELCNQQDTAAWYLRLHHEVMHTDPETVDFVVCEALIEYISDRLYRAEVVQ